MKIHSKTLLFTGFKCASRGAQSIQSEFHVTTENSIRGNNFL